MPAAVAAVAIQRGSVVPSHGPARGQMQVPLRVKQCMVCGVNFGLFTWRHQCYCCARVVCDDCRPNTSCDVPGRQGIAVKVCPDCFYNNLGILVVYHSYFSYKTRFVGDRASADKIYKKISNTSSRVMMRMRNGEILNSWFRSESWRTKVLNTAILQRNSALRPGGSFVPGQPGMAPQPVAPQAQPQANPQQPRVLHRTPVNVRLVLVYRNAEPHFSHVWNSPIAEEDLPEAIVQAKAVLEQMNVQLGGLLRDDGTCLYAFNREDPSKSAELSTEMEAYIRDMKAMVMWSHNQSFEHRVTKYTDLPESLTSIDCTAPCVVLDATGELLMHRNCSPSWKESLSKAAGAAILKLLNVPFVVVANSPSEIQCFTNMYTAHFAVMDCTTAAMFVVQQSDARLIQAHPFVNREDAQYWLAGPCIAAAEQQTRMLSEFQTSSATAPQAPTSRTEMDLECPVCMEPFDLETRRPCICGHCGNTACISCLRMVAECPSCRKPTEGRYPPNVAIMRLLA